MITVRETDEFKIEFSTDPYFMNSENRILFRIFKVISSKNEDGSWKIESYSEVGSLSIDNSMTVDYLTGIKSDPDLPTSIGAFNYIVSRKGKDIIIGEEDYVFSRIAVAIETFLIQNNLIS